MRNTMLFFSDVIDVLWADRPHYLLINIDIYVG